MKKQYITPTFEQQLFVFERGFDLSTGIKDWENNGEDLGGSAE